MAIDPISDQVFSHDYPKFVYQDPDEIVRSGKLPKPFTLESPEKPSKAEKDLKKEEKDRNKKGEDKKKN